MTDLLMERLQIREDLIAGKVPKRVPIYPMFNMEFACSYAGINLMEAHFDFEAMEKAFDAVCTDFFCDSFSITNNRFPESYYRAGSNIWKLGSTGTMQHPESESLRREEYDDFIADPIGFMMGTLLPRKCERLTDGGIPAAVALAQSYESYTRVLGTLMGLIMKLSEKHSMGPGLITGQTIVAPCDYLADTLRGFSQISIDFRRCPDKVEAAINAILPIMKKQGLPRNIKPGTINFVPLHQAPFMNMQQFERMYWPTLKELLEEMDRHGVYTYVVLEHDFTRYFEHFATLPSSVIYMCEYGDLKYAKETIGKEHVIGGFYDPHITLSKSKEECIDEAKRMNDIGAPDGRFYFGFSKAVMDTKTIDASKLAAVLEWVHVNGSY